MRSAFTYACIFTRLCSLMLQNYDIPTAKTKKSLPKKKLQAQNEQEESGPKSTEINEEGENGPNSSEISHRSPGGSDGFRPPPGIVHEALTSAGKK